ncbi:hypothetical protein N825_14925 [Skermanella stibiiresistens SB22]|uniref:Cytoplasmic protein n=1 Tax=Skermanella stibiiresistens SB22 TaxID=1385369 RepID=W9H0H3_9PROT|nr:cell cycle transcriptional regulator TrcR [Skermanella stibiiresistens]EWY38197.1 hypothetical protein N825_14925 [Skermanella stibiiresistens SB22]
MPLPLMPKATAVWLVENTSLTFEQIAAFCGLHSLEIKAIADGEVAVGMVGLDPIANGQLSKEEIERAEKDEDARLRLLIQDLPQPVARSKGPRYTPVTKRGDKPDAIAWLVKQYPDLSDAQVSRLIGTTKPTIAAVRDRTHWNSTNIKPRSPVLLGLCTQRELEEAIATIRRPAGAPAPVAEDEDGEESEGYEAGIDAPTGFGDDRGGDQGGDDDGDRDHGKYAAGPGSDFDETVD